MGSNNNTTSHRADAYDAQIRQTIAMYDWFNEQVLDLVKIVRPSPASWLDTGCGTGSLVKQAVQFFPGTSFILADPSSDMMKIAREKLEESGAGRTLFLPPAPTQNLNLPAGQRPDVITAIQAHHYLSAGQRAAATCRCFDLLSPGGLYVVSENVRPLSEVGTGIALQRVENFQVSAGKQAEEAAAHSQRFDREYHPITVEEHLELYRRCGFTVVELLWYSYCQAGFYCIKY